MYSLKRHNAYLVYQYHKAKHNLWNIKSNRSKYRDLLRYIKDTFKEVGPEYSDDIMLDSINETYFHIVFGLYREHFLTKEVSIFVDVKQYNEFNGDIRLCKIVLDKQASYNSVEKVYNLVFPTIGEKTLAEI